MTAKLATADDRILPRVEEAGVIRDGSIISRSAGEKLQISAMQFDCGYLSPHFVTVPGALLRNGAGRMVIVSSNRWV